MLGAAVAILLFILAISVNQLTNLPKAKKNEGCPVCHSFFQSTVLKGPPDRRWCQGHHARYVLLRPTGQGRTVRVTYTPCPVCTSTLQSVLIHEPPTPDWCAVHRERLQRIQDLEFPPPWTLDPATYEIGRHRLLKQISEQES